MKQDKNKKCFVITPIGDEKDPIRRHIDGIIKASIRPALVDYEVIVAHEITEPGTITKQVLKEIYEDDLVIANLTNNNPNVMYELAFRHCLGKPTIMIAEKGTSLPSDIIMERTIFYFNDAQGVIELKEALTKTIKNIDFEQISSPIHDVIKDFAITNRILENTKGENNAELNDNVALQYIIDKLNNIEERLYVRNISQLNRPVPYSRQVIFECSNMEQFNGGIVLNELQKITTEISGVRITGIKASHDNHEVGINTEFSKRSDLSQIIDYCVKTLESFGLGEVKLKK